MLFSRQDHIQKNYSPDTIVYCFWTCSGESEEREGEDRERETEGEGTAGGQRERQEVVVSQRLCSWSSNKKKAAAAKHVYELVYMSEKQHRERKKLTNETRDFEPMQSAALPCVSTVVNL